MSSKLNIFLICAFMLLQFASCSQFVDYRIDLQLAACTPRNCTQSGPLCETCSSLVGCIEEDGGWIKTPLATCRPDQYCVDGACTVDSDPYCAGIANSTFTCNDRGVFPDPFYKTRFVFCLKSTGTSLSAYVNECDSGFHFNIKNDLCDISGNVEGCPGPDYPVPLCTETGQTGPIPDKPAMYYICRERSFGTKTHLYPYLYLCPGGEEYVNFVCSLSSETTTVLPTTAAPPTLAPTTAPPIITA